MNISAWSIRNPVPAILLFVLLSIVGLFSLQKLAIQDFPDIDLPMVNISATLEGAAPAQLETEVARKIEDQLTSLSKLEHISTTITDGSVAITVLFDVDKNSDEALNEVRNAVDAARASLPSGMDSPTVSKPGLANTPLLTYSVEATNMGEDERSWFVDNEISKALLAVPGVAKVARVAGVEREIQVDLDPALMAGLGVTLNDIATPLSAMQRDASGGRGEVGHANQSLRTLGAMTLPSQMADLSLPLPDGRRIALSQIARISDTHASRSTRAYVDGREVIGFQVTRAKGYSDVSVAESVRAAVGKFAESHPQAHIAEVSNTVEPVKDNYRGSMQLLFEGSLLAVIVVWGFLKDWRATVISATALPLSIVPTFAAMHWAGFSLNGVSLIALALVVGILVDDAIVEVENIARHIRMGKTPYQAALDAADEIGLAVVATTLTLVAVFLPTAFMGGIPGLIFRQFGITAAAAVLASLLVARLLTPMMAAYFMKASPHEHVEPGWLTRYLRWAQACLQHRGRTLAIALLFFVGSLALTPLLSAGFLPPMDRGQTTVNLELAPGATIEETSSAAQRAEAMVRSVSDVDHVFASVGVVSMGDGPDASTSNDVRNAVLTVDLKPRDERRPLIEVEAQLRAALKALPGARVAVGAGNDGEKLEITLASDDSRQLEASAATLEREMRSLRGIGQISSNAALQRPEIQIRPDMARAAEFGITSESLGDTIRLATNGDYANRLNKLNLPQRQIPVRVRLAPEVRQNIDTLGELRIAGSHGLVALSSVADIQLASSTAQTNRIDRYRNVTLSVELNGRALGDVMEEVHKLPTLRNLPKGVFEIEQGEVQRMNDLFGSFGIAMLIGIFCIYGVLVLLFHDFLQPATILAALPLSVGGALLSLVITNTHFTMPVVIGMLMLMGVVTKNSILLVEYAVMARRERGVSRLEALLDACHKRARPIVMTTIAMAAGMLPIALGMGTDPSFRQPMAIVVIGGLLASTLLSLLVIPVVFTYVDDLLSLFKSKKHGDHDSDASPSHHETVTADKLDWRVMAPLFIVVMIDAISMGVIMPLLPFYSQYFGATPFVIGALVAVFSLCQFISSPWLGKLSDRHGRKPILLVSQAGTALSLVILATATSLPFVFLARILDGLTAGNMSVAAAYAIDHSTPATRKRAVGAVSAALGIGIMIGPALSGLLSHVSITAPIWAAAVISLLSVTASAVLLPKASPPAQYGASPAKQGLSLASVFKMPDTATVLTLLALFYFAFGMYTSQLPLVMGAHFEWNGKAFGAREAGFAFVGAGAINIFVQLWGIRWIEKRVSDKLLAAVSFGAIAVGYLLVGTGQGLFVQIAGVVMASFGTSFLRPTLISTLTHTVGRQQQGMLMGLNQSLMAVSNIIAPLVAGFLIEHSLYLSWSAGSASLVVTGLLATLMLIRSKRWPAHDVSAA